MRDHRDADQPWRPDEPDTPDPSQPPRTPDVPTPPHRDVPGGTEDVPEPPNRDEVDPRLPDGRSGEVQEGDDVSTDAGTVEPPD